MVNLAGDLNGLMTMSGNMSSAHLEAYLEANTKEMFYSLTCIWRTRNT